MPLLTTVIDDKSPLILYDATWLPGSSGGDPLAVNYYLGTFTTNNVTNGAVTFDFNGTAVWVYGAERQNHGTYTVQVDSQIYSGYNGDNANNLFQQVLFNLSTLSQERHTLKLTNTGTTTANPYVDIDMIVWQSEIGNADDQLVPALIQDTDSRFNYQGSGWGTTSSTINLNLFNNGSGHVTGAYDATVAFTFTVGSILFQLHREVVTLFGTSGPNNGPYSVQLDGGQAVTYNATNAYPTNYGVVIYHADNLGSGSHQIILTNLPAVSSQPLLSIDYAQLWTISNTSTLTSSSSSGSGSDSANSVSQSQNLSAGAIAGLVIAVAAAVIGFGTAMFFYRRWKALLPMHDGTVYKHDTSQQQPAGLAAVVATAFSSSLEARSNRTVLRGDSSTQAFSGGTRQLGDNREAQHDGAAALSSSRRDSLSNTYAVTSTIQSSMNEGLGHRPLPDAPGGGLSLSAEFPKLTGAQRRRSLDVSSVAISDVPPNYNQAVGNMTSILT